jgi:hypothetical protein
MEIQIFMVMGEIDGIAGLSIGTLLIIFREQTPIREV